MLADFIDDFTPRLVHPCALNASKFTGNTAQPFEASALRQIALKLYAK
jgi:hypothetical protein